MHPLPRQFMWIRGPQWIFYLDFVALTVFVYLMSEIFENPENPEWPRYAVIPLIFFLILREIQLAWELRRQELTARHLKHRDICTQFGQVGGPAMLRGSSGYCVTNDALTGSPARSLASHILTSHPGAVRVLRIREGLP